MWFSSWLRNPKRSDVGELVRTHGFSRQRATCRPMLEALEERCLPSFSSAPSIPIYQPGALATADVNGDGKPDLIAATSSGVSVMLGKGYGHFTIGAQYLSGGGTNTPTAVTVADVNGDGKPDIVLANDPGDGAYFGLKASISVLLNNGNGTFARSRTYYVLPSDAYSIAVGDFNGDGRLDIVAGGYNSVSVLLNHGNGWFPTVRTYTLPRYVGPARAAVAVGDFNGDGKPDIVATAGGTVNELLNIGNGTFGAVQTYSVGGFAAAVAVGDFNGDGKPDIVTANGGSNTVSVLLNMGDGTGAFGPAQNYAVGGAANAVAVGDFNGDSKVDIVVAGAELDVLLNKSDGTFGAAQKVGPAGNSVVLGDFNGDGFPDLAQIDALATSLDVLLNSGKKGW